MPVLADSSPLLLL